jgi:hypothetical protein
VTQHRVQSKRLDGEEHECEHGDICGKARSEHDRSGDCGIHGQHGGKAGSGLRHITQSEGHVPFMSVLGVCRGVISEQSVEYEQGGSEGPYGVG